MASDIQFLELQAICNGLRIAWNRGIRHLVLESNSLYAVRLIARDTDVVFHAYAALVCDIPALLACA